MKKQISVLIFCSTASCFAQTVSPEVVATSGDYFTGSAANLSWTLGEVVTDTYFGTSNQLTQGFQQPRTSFSLIEDMAPEVVVSIYPNPTSDEVNIELKNNDQTLVVTIRNAAGQTVFNDTYTPGTIKKIDFSNYADGMYYMQFDGAEKWPLKTYKIQKF
jgi:hypothetical protein